MIVTTDELETVDDDGFDIRVTVGDVLSNVFVIVKVKLSFPEYTLPAKSVADTVAVVEVRDVDTVQVYSHTEADEVANITTFDTIPLKLNVGVAAIASEKVAVIVTTDELETVDDDGLDDN